MVATRPDDEAWAAVGRWLRDVREARGWTLIDVAGRRASNNRRLIGDTRLRQIEKAYHPDGYPQTPTRRAIELALWIRPGRIDVMLEYAGRGLNLPDPRKEPIVQPEAAAELEGDQRPADPRGSSTRDGLSPADRRATSEEIADSLFMAPAVAG